MNTIGRFDDLALADVLAIHDLKAQYFQHLDAKRWEPLRELFSEDAKFEGFAFDSAGGREAFVATLAEFLADVRSQHQGCMPRLRRTGTHTARGIWTMHDYLSWEPNSRNYKGLALPGVHGLRGYGFYEEEYVLTNNGWRISFSRLVRTRIDMLVGEPAVTPEFEVLGPDPHWLD